MEKKKYTEAENKVLDLAKKVAKEAKAGEGGGFESLPSMFSLFRACCELGREKKR